MDIPTDCTNCNLHETRLNIVHGDGPTDSPIMWIAQSPGKHEDKAGLPLVDWAKTGKEFNWLLARNGFNRRAVYVTNLVKCHPPNDADPKPGQIAACSNWLGMEMAFIKPKYVVTIGHFATRFFMPDVNLESVHGIPFQRNNGQVLIPVYHVAGGFHQPAQMLNIHLDFRAVAEIVKGARPPRHIEDEFAGKEQYHVLTDEDLES